MRIAKVAAAAVLSTTALGVAAATAHGEANIATVPVVSSVDQGVEYTAAVAADRSSATVTLASGKFVTTPAGVSVQAPDGSVVATVPTSIQTVAGQQVQVAPQIDAAATTLTLHPVGAAVPEPGAAQFIGDAGTTVAGVLIGCAIGALIGLIFLVVGLIPGCVIGGIIGGIVGANQP
ncbi:hypothetical protein NDR87_15805 [Nocardia sp. CDC159]|uniref:DUF8020 domain-containing protein n=1 Tax=Nocardia pulmonis TaxID=2951408 RepID=A0A9X2EBX4_9NOCA|nr:MULTISPECIES: hypothetical protein [Nocardia]MCM6775441.1 hypothetical protein [Nocardia pulmonis]MCM6787825.1 hypothetical protein [Nocardia sp. CDC159]